MEIELAAVHEAGHAVTQWLIGWELKGLHMTIKDGTASSATTECPKPPLSSKAAVRRRLLMLFSGNAATQQRWPNTYNDWHDWLDALRALQAHFQRNFEWKRDDGYFLKDVEANQIVQEIMGKSMAVVEHSEIRKAIDEVAKAFIKVLPDENGRVFLSGPDAIEVCEAELSKGFPSDNPWSSWLDGN